MNFELKQETVDIMDRYRYFFCPSKAWSREECRLEEERRLEYEEEREKNDYENPFYSPNRYNKIKTLEEVYEYLTGNFINEETKEDEIISYIKDVSNYFQKKFTDEELLNICIANNIQSDSFYEKINFNNTFEKTLFNLNKSMYFKLNEKLNLFKFINFYKFGIPNLFIELNYLDLKEIFLKSNKELLLESYPVLINYLLWILWVRVGSPNYEENFMNNLYFSFDEYELEEKHFLKIFYEQEKSFLKEEIYFDFLEDDFSNEDKIKINKFQKKCRSWVETKR